MVNIWRGLALVALLHSVLCSDEEFVRISFKDEANALLGEGDYNRQSSVFRISRYLQSKVEEYVRENPEREKDIPQVELVCTKDAFEIVDSLLDRRPLTSDAGAGEIGNILGLAETLRLTPSKGSAETEVFYTDLAEKIAGDDEAFRSRVEEKKGLRSTKKYVLCLLRNSLKAHGIEVEVSGRRATLCHSSYLYRYRYGMSYRVEVVDEVEILVDAMKPIGLNDALEKLRWFASVAEVRALYVSECQELPLRGEEMLAILTNVPGITSLTFNSSNIVSGSFERIHELASLRNLSIFGNKMPIGAGDFQAIAKIPSLENLKVHRTRVDEGCFLHLQGHSKLCNVDLADNTFNMNREDIEGISKIPNLRSLHIYKCGVEQGSLELLGGLGSSMKSLSVTGNHLIKADLLGISKITSLDHLYISNFSIEAGSHGPLGALSNLRVLDTSRNDLNEEDMKGIGSARALMLVFMRGCKIEPASSTASLSGLASLEKLDISEVALDSEKLAGVAMIPNLKELDISMCTFETGSLAPLESMKCLSVLRASQNTLKSGDMKIICSISGLNSLVLKQCNIEEGGLAHLSLLKNLQNLDISNISSTISGSDMSGIGSLKNLRSLEMRDCKFNDGILLENLRKLENLGHLDVTDCWPRTEREEVVSELGSKGVRVDG